MSNLIEHLIEPEKLSLVWQASSSANRGRLVVGELSRSGGIVSLRYLTQTTGFLEAEEVGFAGFPAFPSKKELYSEGVLDTFLKRLPPRSRTDFPKYLKDLRLPTDYSISDFALLGYSEAKLPGDGFSILPNFSDVEPPFEFLSEIAGFRYSGANLENISLGDRVEFEREPDNRYDPNAIKVAANGNSIGYINRVHAPSFAHWLETHSVNAVIERINGNSERPMIYLFVKIRA